MTIRPIVSRRTRVVGPADKSTRHAVGPLLIGTTLQWFDFLVYAQTALLILGAQFFGSLGAYAQTGAVASIAAAFLLRPIGAVLRDRLENRFGSAKVGAGVLAAAGLVSAVVAVVPTAATVGSGAVMLLLAMRLLLGLVVGGDWERAAVAAVSAAPADRRGFGGSRAQWGIPLSMVLAPLVVAGVYNALGPAAYAEWAWRVPFLCTLVLGLIGACLRLLAGSRARSVPVEPVEVVASVGSGHVLFAGLAIAANIALVCLVASGLLLAEPSVAPWVMADMVGWFLAAGVVAFVAIVVGAWLSDRMGGVPAYKVVCLLQALVGIALVSLLANHSHNAAGWVLVISVIPVGLTLGPLPAMLVEILSSRAKTAEVSAAFSMGAIAGGVLVPLMLLVPVEGAGLTAVARVMIVLAVVGMAAASRLGVPDLPLIRNITMPRAP